MTLLSMPCSMSMPLVSLSLSLALSLSLVFIVVKVVEDDDREIDVHLEVVDVCHSPTQLRDGSFDDCFSAIDVDVFVSWGVWLWPMLLGMGTSSWGAWCRFLSWISVGDAGRQLGFSWCLLMAIWCADVNLFVWCLLVMQMLTAPIASILRIDVLVDDFSFWRWPVRRGVFAMMIFRQKWDRPRMQRSEIDM